MAKQRRTRAKAKPAGKKKRARKLPAPPELSPEEKKALAARQARRKAALGVYERGLAAVQRRNFRSAVAAFQKLLDTYSEEHELRERSRLYLKICERETTRPSRPESPEELVYAATVALNNGDHDGSLGYLRKAVGKDADDERAHYLLAVVYAQTNRLDKARTHLEKAVELKPENRMQAQHETDFDTLREDERVRHLLKRPPAGRRRARRAKR